MFVSRFLGNDLGSPLVGGRVAVTVKNLGGVVRAQIGPAPEQLADLAAGERIKHPREIRVDGFPGVGRQRRPFNCPIVVDQPPLGIVPAIGIRALE
jgi:hypothetical protein